MPIYLEISRLHRCVTIVARGEVSTEEIAGAWRQIGEEGVAHFGKLIDMAASTSGISREQVEQMAQSRRGHSPEAERGPVAFLIDPRRPGFAALFADAHDTRRVQPVHQPPQGARLADPHPGNGVAGHARGSSRRARGKRPVVRPGPRGDDVSPQPAPRRPHRPQPPLLRAGVGRRERGSPEPLMQCRKPKKERLWRAALPAKAMTRGGPRPRSRSAVRRAGSPRRRAGACRRRSAR